MTSYPSADSQRGKLYKAERAVFLPNGQHIMPNRTKAKADAFIQKAYLHLAASGRIDYPYSRPVTVAHQHGYGGAWASRQRHKISLTICREDWVLCHEVAHLASSRDHPRFDGDLRGHGWVFADNYSLLVRKFISVKAAHQLRTSFEEHGVQFTPKGRG
jgi:hypothetical protein